MPPLSRPDGRHRCVGKFERGRKSDDTIHSMDAVKVSITRFLGYDPQPGIVEFELIDASGRIHTFIAKTAIIIDDRGPEEHLKVYPYTIPVACTILGRRVDESSREVVKVTTEYPWTVISTEDQTEFEVFSDQLTSLPDAPDLATSSP